MVRKGYIFILAIVLIILLVYLFNSKNGGNINQMKISSPAFENNGVIPPKYTCDGEDVNPPLEFSDIPENAASLVLIVDDPDAPAGTWVHWVVFDIPPETRKIEENASPNGVRGKNDFGTNNYGGPCPPSGTHRYYFKIYALNSKLNLKEGSSKEEIEKAMKGHILDRAELIGKYRRT